MTEGMEEGGYADEMVTSPPPVTFDVTIIDDKNPTGIPLAEWQRTGIDTSYTAIEATRRLLDDDAVAATMVATTINIRQAAGESGGAFVKRIVRSWLTEMGRGV